MAVVRYTSDRFVGDQNDVKPLDVLDGAVFYERNTLLQYLKITGAWSLLSGGQFFGTGGVSGFSGYSGISGYSGVTGFGVTGATGISGFSGFSGFSGYSGITGATGVTGISGYSGFSGFSGYSGLTGVTGATGISGYSGFSGFSGFSGYTGATGFSGFSGFSGLSGYSGITGATGISGYSGFSGFSGISPGGIVFDSVSGMKVYTIQSNTQAAYLLGYYRSGDGGHGNVYWDAGDTRTENSGTIFQRSAGGNGRWIRTVSGPIDVRMFGARGSGIQDDSSVCFQKAINASNVVFVPSGFYYLTGSLSLNSHQIINGEGVNSLLFFDKQDQGFSISAQDNVVIQNLAIGGTTCRAIKVGAANKIKITDCQISGVSKSGTNLFSAAISFAQCNDLTIENNLFFGNGAPETGIAELCYVILGESNNYQPSNKVRIHNNTISGLYERMSITLFDCHDCEISRNFIDGNNQGGGFENGYGITHYSTLHTGSHWGSNKIIGNIVRNTNGSAIYVSETNNCIVTDNDISNCAQGQSPALLIPAAISFCGNTNSVCANNKIAMSKQWGIAFTSSIRESTDTVNCVCVGNVISGTVAAGIGIRGYASGLIVNSNAISYVTGINAAGIEMSVQADNCVISNNFIANTTFPGINMAIGNNNIISNNRIDRTPGQAILVLAGSRNTINNNFITNTGGVTNVGIQNHANNSYIYNNQIIGFGTPLIDFSDGSYVYDNMTASNLATISIFGNSVVKTVPPNISSTPVVEDCRHFILKYPSGVTITNFLSGNKGDIKTFYAGSTGIILQNNINLRLSKMQDYSMASGDVIMLANLTGGWNEVCRNGDNLKILREDYLPSGNIVSGTLIGIPNARVYQTGTQKLEVFCNGVFQRSSTGEATHDGDYWEIASTGIYMTYALASGTVLSFYILG